MKIVDKTSQYGTCELSCIECGEAFLYNNRTYILVTPTNDDSLPLCDPTLEGEWPDVFRFEKDPNIDKCNLVLAVDPKEGILYIFNKFATVHIIDTELHIVKK